MEVYRMIATSTIIFHGLNNLIYSLEPPHINGKLAK
jgi:hypothetical protein